MISILDKIALDSNIVLKEWETLSGGDINDVFLLTGSTEKYVAKINFASKFPGMFGAEAYGLQLLRSSDSFRIPDVIKTGTIHDKSYLLLEYIDSGPSQKDFWQRFAENLCKLHKHTAAKFGLEQDNYIGSLPQYNSFEDSPSEFFINKRLDPQFRMARDKGFSFSKIDIFFKIIENEIPKEPSSLIHGDLWGGNYIISYTGEPVLIDPAVAYAPREMDIGMMKLFGGFPAEVFLYYQELFPMMENYEQRIRIWQLYYLLVHLNLFGSGYLSQVNSILKHYS